MPKRGVGKRKSSAGKVKKSKKKAEGCSEPPPDALNNFMKQMLKFLFKKKDGYNWLAFPFTNVGLHRMHNKTIGLQIMSGKNIGPFYYFSKTKKDKLAMHNEPNISILIL